MPPHAIRVGRGHQGLQLLPAPLVPAGLVSLVAAGRLSSSSAVPCAMGACHSSKGEAGSPTTSDTHGGGSPQLVAEHLRPGGTVKGVVLDGEVQANCCNPIIVEDEGYCAGKSAPSRSGGRRNFGFGSGSSSASNHFGDDFARVLVQARKSGNQSTVRSLLTKVADDNYKMSRYSSVPETFMVEHKQCLAYRMQPLRDDPVVSFSGMTTADALLHFGAYRGHPVCGLNFANGSTVGGGYKHGATAQEEDLCRRIPALYTSLLGASKRGYYPFGPCTCRSRSDPRRYCDVLYTPQICVTRGGEAQGFAPLDTKASISLVTAAAPNVRFASELDDPDLVRKALWTIFVAPKMREPQVDTLILGAWGCGAFGGDPHRMSDLFLQALIQENLGRLYREVHFAIPVTNSKDINFQTFRNAFRRRGVKVVDM